MSEFTPLDISSFISQTSNIGGEIPYETHRNKFYDLLQAYREYDELFGDEMGLLDLPGKGLLTPKIVRGFREIARGLPEDTSFGSLMLNRLRRDEILSDAANEWINKWSNLSKGEKTAVGRALGEYQRTYRTIGEARQSILRNSRDPGRLFEEIPGGYQSAAFITYVFLG